MKDKNFRKKGKSQRRKVGKKSKNKTETKGN